MLTPLILAVGMFMEAMDSTVISTALVTIARDIGSEPTALKLAMTAYMLALAIFIPLSGLLADRFGARRVFQFAMATFVVGSLCCAVSDSLLAFVCSRFLQGTGGAMMSPLARMVLVRVTPRHQLVNGMAWLTIPALTGPIIGPPIGGFISTYFSWHWIFVINLPIGLIGIWLAHRFLPEIERRPPAPVDYPGFLLSALAISGIVLGVSLISQPVLPVFVGPLVLASGAVLGGVYARRARRVEHPILDLRLLRQPLFRASIVGGLFFRFGVGAMPLLMPLMLQIGFGMNAFDAGMVIFIGAFGSLGAKFFARQLYQAFGFRLTLTTVSLASAIAIGCHALFFPDTSIFAIGTVLVIAGIVQSTFFTGINAFGVADIEDRDAMQATAITAVAQQIAFAMGVALGGAALELSQLASGDGLGLADFHMAFIGVAVVAGIAVIPFWRMPPHAGDVISGHRQRVPAKQSSLDFPG